MECLLYCLSELFYSFPIMVKSTTTLFFFCSKLVSASFMAKNVLQGIRGTAASHPLAHIGQSGIEKNICRDKIRAPDLAASAGCCTTKVLVCCYILAALPPKTHLSGHMKKWQRAHIIVTMTYCPKYEKKRCIPAPFRGDRGLGRL